MKKTGMFLLVLMLVMVTGCSDTKEKTPTTKSKPVEPTYQTSFTVGDQEITLEEKTFQIEQISMLMPIQFNTMGSKYKKEKYPTIDQDALIYTNNYKGVNIIIDRMDQDVTDDEMPYLFESIYNKFLTQDYYKKAEFIKNSHETVHKKYVGIIEHVTEVKDGMLYTKQWYSSQAGKMVVITFNCPDKDKEDWIPVADEMLKSMQELQD